MRLSLEQFEKSLSDSGLLSKAEVRQFRERTNPPPTSADELAQALVNANKLTSFQASKIADGKADRLVLRDYVLQDKIGEGGMGEVFVARHRHMKRCVAIKAISQKAVDSPKAIARFRREVEIAAQLDHPNIVTAHDAFEVDGRHYLVMQFAEGRDLSSIVRGGKRLTVDQAIDFVKQAARGLEYAHTQGVIHRDIKPGNLLLDSKGTIKILDLGMARVDYVPKDDESTGQLELTNAGQVIGTVDYLAPEQAANTHKADARSDIYSLGCTLYRLVTGTTPYKGETAVEKILAHATHPIPFLQEHNSAVTSELEAVYQRMMAKNPDDRQQSMRELIEQLEAIVPVASFSSASAIAQTATWQGTPGDELSQADSGSHLETATGQYSVRTQDAAPSVMRQRKKRPHVAVVVGCMLFALLLLAVFTAPWRRGNGAQDEGAGDTPFDASEKGHSGKFHSAASVRLEDGPPGQRRSDTAPEVGYEYPDLLEYLSDTVRSRYVRWQNYSDMATVLAGGKEGKWTIGGGLTLAGEPIQINVAAGKWFARVVPRSEAAPQLVEGKMVERVAVALVWRELELAKLHSGKLESGPPDAESRRQLTGSVEVEIVADVPVQYLALAVEIVTPDDAKLASTVFYQQFEETRIPRRIEVSKRLSPNTSLRHGAKLYLIAFVLNERSSFYRITKELTWIPDSR